ncbi:MAG: hypothetical protein QOG64_2266 [Acidimicrobiaceae bacterium]|jgi:murein DD-endopeptidase MepM/ murein hydrolase activator NlpD|nr:hypothetical protein [Acidimicrobiaceae bacterium]
MRLTSRTPLVALVAVLVLLLAPVTPASAKTRKGSGRVDTATASDAELDSAVRAMDAEVNIQQARSDTAHQSLEAAVAQAAAAEAKVTATEADVQAMRTAVMSRAVQAYVHPEAVTTGAMVDFADIGELSRKAALIEQVASQDRETLDKLHAVKSDLEADQQLALRARDLAEQRRQLEDLTLGELRQAKADKQRLQGALQDRVKEYQDEADQVATEESALSTLIRSKEAPAPASRAASAPQDPAAPPPPPPNGRTSSSGLIWPINGPVSSPFGYRWGRLHAGIDISCGIGTPIHAAKSGTVIFAGQMSGYGNVIVIDHGGGFSTLYAHQSRLAVRDGQSVDQGAVIGYSGNTGHSTGPHLHFETRVNANPQNPRPYLP